MIALWVGNPKNLPVCNPVPDAPGAERPNLSYKAFGPPVEPQAWGQAQNDGVGRFWNFIF